MTFGDLRLMTVEIMKSLKFVGTVSIEYFSRGQIFSGIHISSDKNADL